MIESKSESYLSPSSSLSSSPSRSRRSRTLHERLIEVMQEKKQRLGALASPSGRVHSLTEDFLEAFVSDLYFVSVFLITSSKSDWLISFNHRRLSSSMCVYVSPSEFSKFPRRVHSGPDPTIVAQLQRTLYNPSTYSSSISFFISIRSISTFLQDIHSHHHQTFGPTFIHWIVQRDASQNRTRQNSLGRENVQMHPKKMTSMALASQIAISTPSR